MRVGLSKITPGFSGRQVMGRLFRASREANSVGASSPSLIKSPGVRNPRIHSREDMIRFNLIYSYILERRRPIRDRGALSLAWAPWLFYVLKVENYPTGYAVATALAASALIYCIYCNWKSRTIRNMEREIRRNYPDAPVERLFLRRNVRLLGRIQEQRDGQGQSAGEIFNRTIHSILEMP